PSDDPIDQALDALLAALGFAPRREDTSGATLTFRLCNCPYRDAVRDNPEVVCALHKGITRGVVDALARQPRLVAFVPSDPDRAGCLVQVGTPEGADPAGSHRATGRAGGSG